MANPKTSVAIKQPVAPAKSGFKAISCFLVSIIGFVCNGFIFYMAIINKYSDTPAEGMEFLTGFTLVFLLLFSVFVFFTGLSLFISFLILLVKSLKRRPVITILLVGLAMIILITAIIIYKKSPYYLSTTSFTFIHNEMVSLFYLRSIQEDLVQGKSVADWNNDRFKGEMIMLDDELWGLGFEVPDLYDPYYETLLNWYSDMSAAANGDMPWAEVALKPEPSLVSLDMWQLEDSYARSLIRVADLKAAGDLMIANDNREGMRTIAAELAAEAYWLENLANIIDPGILGTNVLIQVYASTALPVQAALRNPPCLNRNGISLCSNQAIPMVQGVHRSAVNYTAGEANAAESWNSAWEPLVPSMTQLGMQVDESGIKAADEDPSIKVSPKLQVFLNECKSKGGIAGGSGGVMERLPVSTGGWSCWYGEESKCWDFLTYTYDRYKGGPDNANCSRWGLLPLPVPNFFEAFNDELNNAFENFNLNSLLGGEWDGNYTFNITNTSCKGTTAQAVDMSEFLNGEGFLIVSGNRIANYDEGYIDDQGHAVSVFNPPGTNVTMDVTFSEINGVRSFTGTYHASQVIGQFIVFDCTGTASGQKE